MTAHEVLWVEDAGRGSCAHVADTYDDLIPSVGELAEEWVARNLPARHRGAYLDAADEAWATAGPTYGGRLDNHDSRRTA